MQPEVKGALIGLGLSVILTLLLTVIVSPKCLTAAVPCVVPFSHEVKGYVVTLSIIAPVLTLLGLLIGFLIKARSQKRR